MKLHLKHKQDTEVVYLIRINGIFGQLLKNLNLKKIVVRIFFTEKDDN